MHSGILGLAPGTFHTMLVMHDGSVWSTGVEADDRSANFVQVIPRGATAAAACNYNSIVLKQDHSVWTAGQNSNGQLSFFDGSSTSRGKFFFVNIIPGATAVAAGGYHSLLLTQDGCVWATGWNKYGQLGDDSADDRSTFIRVISDAAKAVAAGDSHSIVLKGDGSVWATGRNYNGQLGDGSRVDRSTYRKVMAGGAAEVAAGGYHSMVLKQDGSVWATGWNEYGQLGGQLAEDWVEYVQVSNGGTAISLGSRHSMVLKQDGSVWATGHNEYGQLGDGSTRNSNLFVQVINTSQQATAVAAGAFHSMVLNQDGSVWATGSNRDGQFGDGTTASKRFFVRLEPFRNGR